MTVTVRRSYHKETASETLTVLGLLLGCVMSNDDDFAIPENFIGRQVVVKMDIPIVQGGGFALPAFTAMLKANLKGALLLQVDSTEIVYPKSRVWQLEKQSEIAILSLPTMPGRLS